MRFGKFLRFGDRAFHAERSFGQHEFRAVGGEQFAPLDAHGVRHGEDQPVAFDRRHESEADTGIPAGRFDDQRSRRNLSRLFRRFDHADGDAVLDAAGRVEGFHFDQHFRIATVEFADPHQRGSADLFKNIGINFFRHDRPPFLKVYRFSCDSIKYTAS